MRMTVSEVWNGTPDSVTTGGTVGRLPAATTMQGRGELDRPTGKVDHEPARTGEPCVPLVEGGEAPGGAVVTARNRDGIDAPEDAVAHVSPPHLVHRGIDAEVAGALDGRATSAGCTSIFYVGMQPTFRHVPPNVPPSTSATSSGANRASRNGLRRPEPMTMRSWWRSSNLVVYL